MRSVAGAAGAAGSVGLDALGGSINRVSPSATAFVHRDAAFLAQYITKWSASSTGNSVGISRQLAWLREYHRTMRPYASGQAYQNYVDPDLTDWQRAYYGANYPRLQAVKATYDPAGLFRFPQGITA